MLGVDCVTRSSFGSASVTLYNSLATVTCHLCVQDVDSAEACIDSDKKPGVRPIGVGDVAT